MQQCLFLVLHNFFLFYPSDGVKNMNSRTILFLSGLIGLFVYTILPAAWKVFAFLIPAIVISVVFSKTGFSLIIFLLQVVIFLLFPSSFITLNAQVPFDSNVILISNISNNILNVVSGVLLIGVPIVIVIAIVWAFYQGSIDQAISNITKLILYVLIAALFLFIGDVMGWYTGGWLGGLVGFADLVWGLCKTICNGIGTAINTIDVFNLLPQLPTIPNDISLSQAIQQDFISPSSLSLTLTSSFPIVLCLFAIIFPFFAYAIHAQIPQISMDSENQISKPRQIVYSLLIYAAILLFCYFALYLWLGSRGFNYVSAFLSYSNMGYFTIYLSIIIFSSIVLGSGLACVTLNSKNTFVGVMLGLSALYFTFNLFQQTQLDTLSNYANEYQITALYQIFVQLIAICPAESLLFHVLMQSMLLYVLFSRLNKYDFDLINRDINNLRSQNDRAQLQVSFYQTQLLSPQIVINQEGKSQSQMIEKILGDNFDLGAAISTIDKNNRKIKDLEQLKLQPITPSRNMLPTSYKVIFFLGIVIFNFGFASMHYFFSGMTFENYWISGLGLIYWISGTIMSLVSYKYGWAASIIVHCLNNCVNLLMIFFSV